MRDIPCYQIDAFTDRLFAGNPAAVCPLDAWLPDETLQNIAAENALSETAFVVPRADGDHDLRWHTPTTEVDLCGHATLATAFVMMTILDPSRQLARFHTRSGALTVTRAPSSASSFGGSGARFTLDFPARVASPAKAPEGVIRAIGKEPTEVLRSAAHPPATYLLVYERAEDVLAITPDMGLLASVEGVSSVIVTAKGTGPHADADFVSRFFAPAKGVPEDPVTGSAHCSLTPFWAERLGRSALRARQVSARTGEILCALEGDRVKMTGSAVLVKTGTFHLPAPSSV